jgi:nucleolar protein 58
VQILGAEKALFRALKTKHDTPKYGLIYHASLIGQTAPKNKGKISRVLAAKTALAIRVDAMGETTDTTLGLESRAKVREIMLCSHMYARLHRYVCCLNRVANGSAAV